MVSPFPKQLIRERVTSLIRQYFNKGGFREIDTPTLIPSLPIEPNLYPLKTNWSYRQQELFLATSPESSLKKLISQGIGNCFTIAKVFRDLEDIGPTHNLEFSMLEWYEMGHDYYHLAKSVEKLINYIYVRIDKEKSKRTTNILTYQNQLIDLSPPWHRVTLQKLFLEYAGIDLAANLSLPSIIKTAAAKGYNVSGVTTWEPLYTQIFVNEIEPRLPTDKPVFIFDYPAALSPLCQVCPKHPGFSQRFELYIGGMEIANGYTELTDAKTMESNFKAETEFRRQNRLPLHPYDQDLVQATTHFPSCTGIGLGVDRLAMLFANTAHVDDVLYFPTSKMIS